MVVVGVVVVDVVVDVVVVRWRKLSHVSQHALRFSESSHSSGIISAHQVYLFPYKQSTENKNNEHGLFVFFFFRCLHLIFVTNFVFIRVFPKLPATQNLHFCQLLLPFYFLIKFIVVTY